MNALKHLGNVAKFDNRSLQYNGCIDDPFGLAELEYLRKALTTSEYRLHVLLLPSTAAVDPRSD